MSPKEQEELLDAVDASIDRLKTSYEQYFMGIQKQAPAHLHTDVERKLRDLAQLNIRNTGLRYRLAMIQQRFGSYNTYWRRTLRQIENGTYARNLAKVGRDAIRAGTDIPEEILAAMPKRMREQILRDRDQALAIAKRRNQISDAEEVVPSAAAVAGSSNPDRRTQSGAFALHDSDAELDIENLFAAFGDDGAGAPGDQAKPAARDARTPPAHAAPPVTPPAPAGPGASGAMPAVRPTPPAGPGGTGAMPAVRPTPPASPGASGTMPPVRPAPPAGPGVTGAIPVVRPTPPASPGASGAMPPVRPAPPAGPGVTGAIPVVRPTPPASPGASGSMPPARPTPPAGPGVTGAIPVVRPPPPASPGASGSIPPARPSPPASPGASGAMPPARPTPTPQPAAAAASRPPPGMTDAEVNALHAKYVQAKQMVGEKVDASSRDKLLRTIQQTAPKVMEQYKSAGVEFSVVVKDNQVVIKAKPKG